jgi:hypothetical protein
MSDKDVCEMEGTVTAFMCLIDWKYEAGFNGSGNSIFYSEESLRQHRPCVKNCGIARVKVSFDKVIQDEVEER